MYDIFYISKEKDYGFLKLQEKFPLLKLANYEDKSWEAFFVAQKKSMSKFFWIISEGFEIENNFKFDYIIPEWDEKYVHIFKDRTEEYTGVYLIPKKYNITKREAEYNFFVNKKEIDIVAGYYLPYNRFVITTPDDYFEAQKKCKTKMFYAIDKDYESTFENDYIVPDWDQKYVHIFKEDHNEYKGVYLIPKRYNITQKEAQYNFFVNKKEIDIVASKLNYDRFVITTPDDYFEAQKYCKTTMFYAIDKDYIPTFELDYIVPEYDKEYVHVFKNKTGDYGGLYLIPKKYNITQKEAEYSFFINKKEIDIECSYLCFDIVFISYNEPNADENYKKLKEKFPRAKRVQGIKGIHNAHVEAAKMCQTSMFWAVDGDAIIEDDFNFYMEVPIWDRDAVYVFKSRNSVNNLIYGYGGVKLLPTQAVIEMNINTVDMTTSISKKFISVNKVSNVTIFNTDPFNTWKSAFRECVKLSSKIIQGQVDEESQRRLEIWCNIGIDKPFGEFAINGAIAGKEFGSKYANDEQMLKNINDWKWLKDEFER